MKSPAQHKPSAQFIKTDGGKTKSNTIEIPSVSLPKGGGAMKGIDEKFSVNAFNGTSAFSVPLPFSAARGSSPSLNLSYNSGNGNGIFGLGWSASLGSVKRKTDKGLPQYLDAIDSDTFLFSEAEDLVPEFAKNADGSFKTDAQHEYIIHEKESEDGLHTIRHYKPRIEGLFARIERWTENSNGRIRWRMITRDNITTLFGWTDDAIIAHPDDALKIYEWLPEFVFDDKGNCSHYIYKKEDSTGFDDAFVHNNNRFRNGKITYTNLYIEKILYGNKIPYGKFGEDFLHETAYMFQTVFDYGTLTADDSFEKIHDWDFRPDAFSDYKAGFEIRTTRLCSRVLLFHIFDELALRPDKSDRKTLIKSVNFQYDTAAEQDFTFLKSVTSYGYIKKPDGTYSYKKLPPIEFEYQKHDWNHDVKSISSDSIIHAPAGLHEPYQFTDLFNEGLSGILTEQANGWYYKHNLGDGKFERAKLISPKPSFAGLGARLHLADLDADGGRQLVSLGAEPRGYFEMDDDDEWHGLRPFKTLPNIDFGDPNTRMLDLDGDGRPEAVISEEQVFTWYASEGRDGYTAAKTTAKPFDEEAGAHIIFADQDQSIYLADMSGDGMTDIVRIRNGEVCYWPNLGYGKFGAKVAFDHAPLFDHPDAFNPAYLHLADIDGSGTSDIIYVGKNKFTCWKNLSGNRFSTVPFEINAFPEIHAHAKITVTDLLGNGVACIVWSSDLPKDVHAPLKYIDLMNSRKPHIMVSYKNNLGKEVSLEYTPSTKFYLEDKAAGKPWVTKLHFPVHCVSKTITEDKISGSRFVSEFKYHHGYYDHAEREFRGFGMVEQTDAESFEHWQKSNASTLSEITLQQEPVVSKTWNHTGAFLQKDKILHQFAAGYWHSQMESELNTDVVHHEAKLEDAKIILAPGMDDAILNKLSEQEWREALRACKGMPLRSENFAKDAAASGNSPEAIKKELTPFSVATHQYVIEMLQPKGKNSHAVFVVKESENITYGYERSYEDPRIAHTLNIKLDQYANILESASVVYPRKKAKIIAANLPELTQQAQDKTLIIYTRNQFTNDINTVHAYHLPLPSETQTFELKEIPKAGVYYAHDDFTGILSDSKTASIPYHETDDLPKDKARKRIIEHVRSVYYRNDLSGPLPLHQSASPVLPFESYQLAYTPELLASIFDTKADAALLTEGKFTHSEGDQNWWVRSGTAQYKTGTENLADVQKRFYNPVSYTDPYGAQTKVQYDQAYFLFIKEIEDASGNTSGLESFNFRTLAPQKIKDINANYSEAVSDELGFVKAVAVLGKGLQADDLQGIIEITDAAESAAVLNFLQASDSAQLNKAGEKLLQHATSRFVYDFDTYMHTGKPAVAASVSRETHYRKPDGSLNPPSMMQLAFEYSNGTGEVVMKKVQAEPGKAKQVILQADNSITVHEIDTALSEPKQLRWIGNGRTVKNNKGNAVKQYEPYFALSWHYENAKELVETGVTPTLYYDAAGRLIKTVMPDGTFSRVEFDAWKHISYDANDTVQESEWYKKRQSPAASEPEKIAALKALAHYNTPSLLHLDTLGRPVLQIENNGKDAFGKDILYKTKIELDAEGNLRKVYDARELTNNENKGNPVIEYKYDMLGNIVYQKSMDAGQRWLLTNILGKPLRTWDERNHEFQYLYDTAHRPLYHKVRGGDGSLNNIFDRIIYGESLLLPDRSNEAALQAKNLLGEIIQHYDTGGVIDMPEYDFTGAPLSTARRLFSKYKEVVNWTDANLSSNLESEVFTYLTETDALGRITKQQAPDGSIITPVYNEAGLLNSESVSHAGDAAPSVYIKNIDYNEKGQRSKIIYGNDVYTKFYYDTETFRLKRLESKRKNGEPLQDWYYTYDPVGNITHIEDKNIPVVFFNNQKIEGVSEYTYDPLYRLTEASGRENNSALNFGKCDNWNDKPFMHSMNPDQPMAVRKYTQRYKYDTAGNMTEMKHVAANANWTRAYEYETASNRLLSTHIGEIDNPASYTNYKHHAAHGFLEELPHLESISWNFKEEVTMTARQHCIDDKTPVTTYYQYDGSGQRIRKITENEASAENAPGKREERIYIAGYELYKKYTGTDAGLKRVSLSLMDEGHRFVMIETRTDIHTEKPLIRYQLHNHLGSSGLELDQAAQVISYEEYHPYGTTAFQATSAAINATAKRYRYTGMERDEETGLEYHSARYYLPWLGRWLSADPIGIEDGMNVYRYCKGNPVNNTDVNGKQVMPSAEIEKQFWASYKRQTTMSILTFPKENPNEVVMGADMRGTAHIGTRARVEDNISASNWSYQSHVLDNIRGGAFGAYGYLVGGAKGSELGANVDSMATAVVAFQKGSSTVSISVTRKTPVTSSAPVKPTKKVTEARSKAIPASVKPAEAVAPAPPAQETPARSKPSPKPVLNLPANPQNAPIGADGRPIFDMRVGALLRKTVVTGKTSDGITQATRNRFQKWAERWGTADGPPIPGATGKDVQAGHVAGQAYVLSLEGTIVQLMAQTRKQNNTWSAIEKDFAEASRKWNMENPLEIPMPVRPKGQKRH